MASSNTANKSTDPTWRAGAQSRWVYGTLPLILVALLGIGWWFRTGFERTVKDRVAQALETFLGSSVTSLEIWLEGQRALAGALAEADEVRASVAQLVALGREGEAATDRLRRSAALTELRRVLEPICRDFGYAGFLVTDPGGMNVGALHGDAVGRREPFNRSDFIQRVLQGESVVSRPLTATVLLPDAEGTLKPDRPTMFAAAPIRNDEGRVIAALSMRIRPEAQFTRILAQGRSFESGESYAFDETGLLLSQSRFEQQLRQVGLLPTQADTSTLNVHVRDPGGNLLQGFRITTDPRALPLTRMAADAVSGRSGIDVDGYRDYRGVRVVGAWTWLENYGFGVATELDYEEALRTPTRLRNAFRGLVGLLALLGLVVFGATFVVSRIRGRLSLAIERARQLGQYTLEEKLGAGGMGEVYRASHAMLRRPTAVKLLPPDRSSAKDITRFEREVQATSRLTHPNTIAIYDYGRTPDGIFYYAMEYLPGLNLARLIEIDGPQPEARVIHILRQVCGSLEEAHSAGLIHRDIKPQNIILCERGGSFDVAKVLDFGIVKRVAEAQDTKLTAVGSFAGTPQYVAPEALDEGQQIDGRCDLYAVGAVGFYLLTGTPLFDGDTVMQICAHHMSTPPDRPSRRLGRPVAEDLEQLLLACLEKSPDRRPADAGTLAAQLGRCVDSGKWGRDQARRWWQTHASEVGMAAPAVPRSPSTRLTAVLPDFGGRRS